MAKKPTRAETGLVVARSAQALSDSLLEDEAAARLAMEARFVSGLAPARTTLARLYHTGLGTALSSGQLSWFDEAMTAIVGECVNEVEALMISAGARAIQSVTGELEAIERNLGHRYDGLAEQAAASTATSMSFYVDEQLDVWVADAAGAVLWFADTVEADWRAAIRLDETAEEVDRRMFSAEGARLPGHGGQGAWWRPLGSIYAAAKAQEFILVNRLRARAIQEFNVSGMALRDG